MSNMGMLLLVTLPAAEGNTMSMMESYTLKRHYKKKLVLDAGFKSQVIGASQPCNFFPSLAS